MTNPLIFSFQCIEDSILGRIELLISFIPYIIGLLFSVTRPYRITDVTILLISVGFILNNLLNTALRALLRVERPLQGVCGDGFGLPAREPQQLLFFVAINIIFSYRWSGGRVSYSLLSVLSFSVLSSSYVYVHLGYYTISQVLIGALVGTVLGTVVINFIHIAISPLLPTLVYNWDATCRWYCFLPECICLTHVFHWHPEWDCGIKQCTANTAVNPTCCVVTSEECTFPAYDLGAHALVHVIIDGFVYTIIHHSHWASLVILLLLLFFLFVMFVLDVYRRSR